MLLGIVGKLDNFMDLTPCPLPRPTSKSATLPFLGMADGKRVPTRAGQRPTRTG